MARFSLLALLAALAGVAAVRADDIESRLLDKFDRNAKAEVEKLKQFVEHSALKAKVLKDTDPDGALEMLRQAGIRIDRMTLLPYAERKALTESIRPVLQETRDGVLLRKRVEATRKPSLFRDYLENVAPELRNPGRSGPDHWEPAYGFDPGGRPQLVQLFEITGPMVKFKADLAEKNMPPTYFPWVQVAGGFYVYDLSVNVHVWIANQDFFRYVFLPLVDEYVAEDPRNRGIGARDRSTTDPLLQAEVDNGVFFLRGMAAIQPIPGLVDRQEQEFMEFAAQRILRKGVPTTRSRIWDRDMLEKLGNLPPSQISAVNRSLLMLRQKGVASSKLYAEILRTETESMLRSEYPTFNDAEINRSLVWLFSKLKE